MSQRQGKVYVRKGGAQSAGQSIADKLKAQKRIFRRSKVPRGKWLCLNDSGFGEHSLYTHFRSSDFSKSQLVATVDDMGKRTVMFTHPTGDIETLFKADRAERWGPIGLRWIALGSNRRNLNGSVAIAEATAARELGACQMSQKTPLHVKLLVSDGDANNHKAFREGQQAEGKLLETELSTAGGALCHDLKNAGKHLIALVKKHLTPAAGLTNGRVKAMCGDIRRNMTELAAMCSRLTTNEEKLAVCEEAVEKRFCQIINHHMGDCDGCDPKWCRNKRLMVQLPHLSQAAREAIYFGANEDAAEGARFPSFWTCRPRA